MRRRPGRSGTTGRRVWWQSATFFVLVLAAVMQADAQQMSLQEFGQARGLQNLAVTSLAQDVDGFIWAGTQNGIYRNDGVRFDRVEGEEQPLDVAAIAVEGKRVWVAADAGLWLWQDEHLGRVRVEGPPLEVRRYPQLLAPDGSGGVWVVSNSRLLRIVPTADGRWRRQDPPGEPPGSSGRNPEPVTSVMAEANGDLWWGCGKSLCQRRAGRVASWGTQAGVPPELWHWLMRASDGSLWARGARHVIRLEPGGARFSDLTDVRDAADPSGLYPLVEDAQHRIIGAARGALKRWNGHHWERFGTAAGLPAGGRLRALLQDRSGGLWLGMMGAGVLQWLGYGFWENWSVADGLPHTAVWQLARAGPPGREALYAATGAGVAAFDTARAMFRPLKDTAHQEVERLASGSDGALWVLTTQGRVLRFGAAAELERRPGSLIDLPGASRKYWVFAQRAGDVWIGADAGVYHRLADAPDSAPMTLVPGLTAGPGRHEAFDDACEDASGSMWFAGSGGVTRFVQGEWRRALSADKGIVMMACLRDGSFAASTGTNGVHRLVRDGAMLRDLDVTPPILRGRSILALLEDRRGWLWVNTDWGVAVWNRQRWRLLDQSRGLVWNDTSGNALFEDRDGSIWIGTSRGASHLLSPATLFDPVTSSLFIRSITRGDRQLSAARVDHLAWSNDPLQIDLALPAVGDRGALTVEYRLPGFSDEWRETTHLDVRLTGLPPGSYRFEARAVDRELAIPSASTAFDFAIDPPWWRSRGAIATAVVAALTIVWALYRWRIQSISRWTRRLEVLVGERTRDLEASREMLREQATRDSLTGVWNRGALFEILARESSRCGREGIPLTVVLVDIDHFKRVNDTHGHPAGDAVLREFAARLAAAVRPYDAVGRYGGEEFVLVMPNLDICQAEHRARLTAIHAEIGRAPMSIGTVTCSFGVAAAEGTEAADIEMLIARADAALYRAKANGRDRIEWPQAA